MAMVKYFDDLIETSNGTTVNGGTYMRQIKHVSISLSKRDLLMICAGLELILSLIHI